MEEHILFLQQLNAIMMPISRVFDPEMIRRWETVNELLINAYHPQSAISERLRFEFPGLAALIAFPLLEEIARRIAKAWDEEGNLLIDIPSSFGLFRTNSKGVREPKAFKKGNRIVDLSHKLVIMKATLSEEFQRTIESLDRRMSISRIEGVEAMPITVFERIEYLRNMWLHGRRFDGIEAWLVTIFLAMLYFRVPQNPEDRKFAKGWAQIAKQDHSASDKDNTNDGSA